MKWINLAERQPPTDREAHYPILRRISDKSTHLGGIFHLTHETPPRWTLWDPKRNSRLTSENFSNYEWLDESEQSIEESRCCEQNEKLRAQILKLSKLPHDLPLGAHFAEINKWIPDAIEVGYSPNDYPEGFWEGVSKEVKENFRGLLNIVPPCNHEILRFYMDVIEEVKGQKITCQIEVDYLKYKNAEISYQQFIDKWL